MAKSYEFIGGEWGGTYHEVDGSLEYEVVAKSRMSDWGSFAYEDLPPTEMPNLPIDKYIKTQTSTGRIVYKLKQACT